MNKIKVKNYFFITSIILVSYLCLSNFFIIKNVNITPSEGYQQLLLQSRGQYFLPSYSQSIFDNRNISRFNSKNFSFSTDNNTIFHNGTYYQVNSDFRYKTINQNIFKTVDSYSEYGYGLGTTFSLNNIVNINESNASNKSFSEISDASITLPNYYRNNSKTSYTFSNLKLIPTPQGENDYNTLFFDSPSNLNDLKQTFDYFIKNAPLGDSNYIISGGIPLGLERNSRQGGLIFNFIYDKKDDKFYFFEYSSWTTFRSNANKPNLESPLTVFAILDRQNLESPTSVETTFLQDITINLFPGLDDSNSLNDHNYSNKILSNFVNPDPSLNFTANNDQFYVYGGGANRNGATKIFFDNKISTNLRNNSTINGPGKRGMHIFNEPDNVGKLSQSPNFLYYASLSLGYGGNSTPVGPNPNFNDNELNKNFDVSAVPDPSFNTLSSLPVFLPITFGKTFQNQEFVGDPIVTNYVTFPLFNPSESLSNNNFVNNYNLQYLIHNNSSSFWAFIFNINILFIKRN